MFRKEVVLRVEDVYTAVALYTPAGWWVGAGSETRGEVLLSQLGSGKKVKLLDSPGGMMSLVQVPGAPGTMVSIMGLFPPFIGKDAGLWFHTRSEKSWSSRKVLSLPFAHRCEFLPGSEEPVLLAATVSRHKENPADWSKPGELYAVKAGMPDQETWPCEKLDISLTRNHGMFRGMIDGEQSLCISGKEGILRICQDPDGSWQFETLFDQEVSEFSFLDLDGDGRSELVSIEPFHGNSLNIYNAAMVYGSAGLLLNYLSDMGSAAGLSWANR